MAQLKDTAVSGSLRVTDTIYSNGAQFNVLSIPSTSGGTAYGKGTAGQVLVSNGTTVFWGSSTLSASSAGYAATAGRAIYAASAGYAATAGRSIWSSSAGYALSSASAGYSSTAGRAIWASSAGYALSSASAGYSSTAGRAIWASSAGYALSSASAGYATTAAEARHASSAGYALNAASAGYATSAGTSVTASYATLNGVEYIVGTQTASTNAWTGKTTDNALYTGKTIAYKLPYAGTSSGATLNLTFANNTTSGAKTLYINNNSAVTTHYPANSLIYMTYDGTYWRVHGQWNSTYYYESIYVGTAAGTAAKVGTSTNYTLESGKYFQVLIINANTSQSALTLNINGKGAKAIYINGTASSTSNYTLPSGYYLVFYDGTNYYFRTDNKMTGNITGSAGSAGYATSSTWSSSAGYAATAGRAIYAASAGYAATAGRSIYAASAGYAATAGNGGVTSVNGSTGAVTLNTLELFGKTYNGSEDISITPEDIGLSGAMNFAGIVNQDLTDGSTANVTLKSSGASVTKTEGVVVIDSTGEQYVWSDNAWRALGYATDYALNTHIHGNIANGGTMTATATLAANMRLVVTDTSNKITRSGITFGTSATYFLANNGTWQLPTYVASAGYAATAGRAIWASSAGYAATAGRAIYAASAGYAASAARSTYAAKAAITTTTNAIAKYSDTAGTFANSGVTIDSSNNVAMPAKLSVGGAATFAGAINVVGTSTLAAANATTLSVSGATTHVGAVNIAGNTTVANFKATGASTFTAAVNITGDTTVAKFKATGASTFTAAVNMSSTLAVSGATTHAGAVNIAGLTTVNGLAGTADVDYGTVLPTTATQGKVFFQISDPIYEIPAGGTLGQALIKSSSADRAVTWGDVGGKQTPNNSVKFYPSGSSLTTANSDDAIFNTNVYVQSNVLYGACWNDYAEFRKLRENIDIPYGYCVCENGDDTVSLSVERMQPAPAIISDTFGYAIGETEEAKAPIAVSGRVLVYPYENRDNYKPGDCVCAGPEGKVCIMTREEIKEYPDRIVGIVSAVPQYETWGQNNILVDNRIWVKVK